MFIEHNGDVSHEKKNGGSRLLRNAGTYLPHYRASDLGDRDLDEESNPVLQFYCCKKCEAVPLQSWSGPEISRKLRFPDFMTTAQDGGKVVSLTHRPPLPPRKYTWYSFLLEAESTPGP